MNVTDPKDGGGSVLPRLLLRLYPREFREEYAHAVHETYARRRADAPGGFARVRFVLRETLGFLSAAVAERRSLRRRVRPGATSSGSNRRMDPLLRELSHAARRLLRAPGFTAAVVVTLALAIGANAAIFTVVRRVLLTPLPYPQSKRLVALEHLATGRPMAGQLPITSGLYVQYRERVPALQSAALYQNGGITVQVGGQAEQVPFTRATHSLREVLRLEPMIGRWFDEKEGLPGSRPVVVLTYGFWQRRLGGDPGVLGTTIQIDRLPHEVIGVLPRSYAFPTPRTEIWLPFALTEGNTRLGGFNFHGVARLRDGATVNDVRVQANAMIAGLPSRFPQEPFAQTMVEDVRLASAAMLLKDQLVGRVRDALWIVLGAVFLVLLIASANVANLFLVRVEGRQREVAVRRALGASRKTVAGFFLSESLLLAAVSGALGLGLAYAGVAALVALGPVQLPRLHEVHVDIVVLGYTAALSLLAGLFFGVLPLLRRGAEFSATLHETGRGNTAARGRFRVRQALVAVQVALALVLLVSAGLLVRSFERMHRLDLGFEVEDRLVFGLALPERVYPISESARAVAVHNALLERIRALPGVESASAANCLPLQGICFGDPVMVEGRAYSSSSMPPVVVVRRVMDGYFQAVGTALLRGRLLASEDQRRPNSAAVIDQAMADTYFPGEDPIGKRIFPGIWPESAPGSYEIVGVVENTVTTTLTEQPGPKIYLPMGSGPHTNSPIPNYASYVVRANVPPSSLLPAIRAALAELDPNVPIAAAELYTDMRSRAGAQMAFTMILLAIAASVALVLGLVGLYAVVSYAVSQRSTEIGVRMALGARPAEVSAMILRQSGVMVLIGLLAGLAAARASGRMLRAVLFQVEPTDALTYGGIVLTLLVVAACACWLPARRAAHVDPLRALRIE